MNRWKAFFGHLSISAAIVSTLVALFVFYLFPMPFFLIDGGWHGIRVIAAVDVTIGPLLTLIVCNPGKSRGKLIFDFVVIGLLQLSALTFGLWTIYSARTESAVFADGTFYAIDSLTAKTLGPRYHELRDASKTRPFYGVIDLPDNPAERQKLRQIALSTGMPLYSNVDLLIPLGPDAAPEVELSVYKQEKLLPSEEGKRAFAEWLAKHGGKAEDYLLAATWCRYERAVTILDKRTMKVAGHLSGIEIKF